MPSKQFGTNLECLTRDRDVQYKTGASANYLYACLLSAPNWWPRFHSCQTISIIHSPPDHLLTLYRRSFELRAKTCGAEIKCREHVAVLCSWFTQVLKLPPALTDDAWNEDLRRKLCTRSWNDSWKIWRSTQARTVEDGRKHSIDLPYSFWGSKLVQISCCRWQVYAPSLEQRCS